MPTSIPRNRLRGDTFKKQNKGSRGSLRSSPPGRAPLPTPPPTPKRLSFRPTFFWLWRESRSGCPPLTAYVGSFSTPVVLLLECFFVDVLTRHRGFQRERFTASVCVLVRWGVPNRKMRTTTPRGSFATVCFVCLRKYHIKYYQVLEEKSLWHTLYVHQEAYRVPLP